MKTRTETHVDSSAVAIPGPLATLDAEVRATEGDFLAQVATLLDEQQAPTQAAERVRALMFIQRFRSDLHDRIDALQD